MVRNNATFSCLSSYFYLSLSLCLILSHSSCNFAIFFFSAIVAVVSFCILIPVSFQLVPVVNFYLSPVYSGSQEEIFIYISGVVLMFFLSILNPIIIHLFYYVRTYVFVCPLFYTSGFFFASLLFLRFAHL